MNRRFERIRDAALQLPLEERSLLAEQLWDSTRTAHEREIDAEWTEEAERRIEELRSGKVKGVPLAEVMAELRAKYDGSRR